eukprot:IDg994t1
MDGGIPNSPLKRQGEKRRRRSTDVKNRADACADFATKRE